MSVLSRGWDLSSGEAEIDGGDETGVEGLGGEGDSMSSSGVTDVCVLMTTRQPSAPQMLSLETSCALFDHDVSTTQYSCL